MHQETGLGHLCFNIMFSPHLYCTCLYLQKLWILYLGNIISKVTYAVKKMEQETAWEQSYGGGYMSEPSLSATGCCW